MMNPDAFLFLINVPHRFHCDKHSRTICWTFYDQNDILSTFELKYGYFVANKFVKYFEKMYISKNKKIDIVKM